MNHQTAAIESRGLRFRAAAGGPEPAALAGQRGVGLQDGLTKAAMGVARPADRLVVPGGGSGLPAALLAARLGVRHLPVERDGDRRACLRAVMAANSMIRATTVESLPDPADFTRVVTDLARQVAAPADSLPLAGRRGAVVRLPESCQRSAAVFARLSEAGLSHFPRQSTGDVVTFLKTWH